MLSSNDLNTNASAFSFTSIITANSDVAVTSTTSLIDIAMSTDPQCSPPDKLLTNKWSRNATNVSLQPQN